MSTSLCQVPLSKRLDLNDLVLFYKVLNNLVPLHLPHYLKFFDGNSRLRSCHLDNLSIVNSLSPKVNYNLSDPNKNCALNKSFFYRVHLQWNLLPLEIRSISRLVLFSSELTKFLWKSILSEADIDDITSEISDDDLDLIDSG